MTTLYYQVVALLESGEDIPLWNHTGPSGRDWIPVTYSQPHMEENYVIEFVAVRGAGDGLVVSIDDITIKDGKVHLHALAYSFNIKAHMISLNVAICTYCVGV